MAPFGRALPVKVRKIAILREGVLILLTVGTQFPFDRLVKTVDYWAGENRDQEVVAQTAGMEPGCYLPRNMTWKEFYAESEMKKLFQDAEFIVSHAGMGSIIGALSSGKPIVIMPRLSANKEHRNDHQVDTVGRFRDHRGIICAKDEGELLGILDRFNDSDLNSMGSERIKAEADSSLIKAIYDFIHE
jgi:UDP-N-acetylglucosamine transferase subunit ALG13